MADKKKSMPMATTALPLVRKLGIVIVVFAAAVAALLAAALYYMVCVKGHAGATPELPDANLYLSLTSIAMVLDLLVLAMGALMIIPESRWRYKGRESF